MGEIINFHAYNIGLYKLVEVMRDQGYSTEDIKDFFDYLVEKLPPYEEGMDYDFGVKIFEDWYAERFGT